MDREEVLRRLCRRLLVYDPEVTEVVLFGSSVYAPDQAQDMDLLVFTRREKEYCGYLDIVSEFPSEVDVVVREVGKPLQSGFAWHVLGAHQVLYGDGACLREATAALHDPPFEETWAAIEAARHYIEDAEGSASETLKDTHIRDAFNKLFHAARLASMAYLATEETRWGKVKRQLPPEFRMQFEEFVETLHVEYFYHGGYPKESVRGEFEAWLGKVEDYVRSLEGRVTTEERR